MEVVWATRERVGLCCMCLCCILGGGQAGKVYIFRILKMRSDGGEVGQRVEREELKSSRMIDGSY